MDSAQRQNQTILEIRDLSVEFSTSQGAARAVNGLSLHLNQGETLGIVGESGCGKSVTALSVMRLLDLKYGRVSGGEILFAGRDLLALSEKEMQALRGNEISMIFQEPMTALNPVFSIGNQLGEALRLHLDLKGKQLTARTVELLQQVRIPRADKIIHEYPHQLSGGMRQRVMIAMALSCNPQLLIADEPTTALDVTIQAQILQLMRDLIAAQRLSLLFITHDLGVIAEMTDRVLVMYAGRIVEAVSTAQLFRAPRHPYTLGLLKARPALVEAGQTLTCIPGTVPSLLEMPPGCAFAPRCAQACAGCREAVPPLTEVAPGHQVRCFLHQPNQ